MTEINNVDDAWIETQHGTFSVSNPKFNMKDIVHSLSIVNRFTGHTKYPYSVAEHSVLVSMLMQELKLGDPMEGLMHDAVEAYLADVASPWKFYLPDYRKLEDRIDWAIREWQGLPTVKSAGCKEADWLALWIEAWHMMPSKGKTWADPSGTRGKAWKLVEEGWKVNGLGYKQAQSVFWQRYDDLRTKRNEASA